MPAVCLSLASTQPLPIPSCAGKNGLRCLPQQGCRQRRCLLHPASDLAIATFVPVVALVHKSSDRDDSSVDGHIDEDSAGVDGNGDDGGDNENSGVASGKPALFNSLLVYFLFIILLGE